MAKLAVEKNLPLAGWDDGFTDGQKDPQPIPVRNLSNADLYVNPWNNIWEWGGGGNAYRYANAGYKVIMSQS